MFLRTKTQATSSILTHSQCSFKVNNTILSLSNSDYEFFSIKGLKGFQKKYAIINAAHDTKYQISLNKNLVSGKGYPESAYGKGQKITASKKKNMIFLKTKVPWKGVKNKKI